jgi:hypothetical protein
MFSFCTYVLGLEADPVRSLSPFIHRPTESREAQVVARWSPIALLAGFLAVPLSAWVGAPPAPAVPGGPIDTRFTGAEVYLARPQRAKLPAGTACALAESYVDHINAGRFRAAADLFAADAILFEPTRRTYRGLVEIRTFYEVQIGRMRPEVVPVSYLGDERDCMVELATRTEIAGEPRYALVSIDHFTVDAHGKASRMIAFARPPRTP